MTNEGRASKLLTDLEAVCNDYAGTEQDCKLNELFIAALADARRAALSWTSEKPKEPGWYWWRLENGKPEMVVEVRDPNYLDDLREAEWAGPIEPPSQRASEGA